MKREFLVQNPRPDGYHLMMEMFGCDPEKIDSRKFWHRTVTAAVKAAGLTNLGSRFHQFEPHGVTGFTLLAQSHISFHTWPEYGYVVLDIFTCGDQAQADRLAAFFSQRLSPKRIQQQVVRKGFKYPRPFHEPERLRPAPKN